jgi:hypothetical protein
MSVGRLSGRSRFVHRLRRVWMTGNTKNERCPDWFRFADYSPSDASVRRRQALIETCAYDTMPAFLDHRNFHFVIPDATKGGI